MNQAIEANIVRPELPEEADRVEQLLVIFSFLLKKKRKQLFDNPQLGLYLNSNITYLIKLSQVEFRAVQQRIHDLNQEMEVRIKTFLYQLL